MPKKTIFFESRCSDEIFIWTLREFPSAKRIIATNTSTRMNNGATLLSTNHILEQIDDSELSTTLDRDRITVRSRCQAVDPRATFHDIVQKYDFRVLLDIFHALDFAGRRWSRLPLG